MAFKVSKKVIGLVSLIVVITFLVLWTLGRPASITESETFQHVDSDIAKRTKSKCADKLCTEFLTDADHPHFKYCVKKTWKTRTHTEPSASTCHFMNGNGRYPVALASYPGSGNTWVRGLLQEVTGLCTGGVYCDVTLRQDGFPGEELRSGVVLVVKTHQTDPRWSGVKYDKDAPFTYYKKVEHIPVFSSAILLMRSPFDALIAEYNRFLTRNSPDNHILHAGPGEFGSNSKWKEFVMKEVKIWQETLFTFLLDNHNHPVMVVKFEDLQSNLEQELTRMLDFIQVPYKISKVREVVQTDYTNYKRHKKEDFEHFDHELRDYVLEVIQDTVNTLGDHMLLHVAGVADYLRIDVP